MVWLSLVVHLFGSYGCRWEIKYPSPFIQPPNADVRVADPRPYSLTMSVVFLPAGRSYRRTESTKWVDPQPEKGLIEINLEQDIVNFSASCVNTSNSSLAEQRDKLSRGGTGRVFFLTVGTPHLPRRGDIRARDQGPDWPVICAQV